MRSASPAPVARTLLRVLCRQTGFVASSAIVVLAAVMAAPGDLLGVCAGLLIACAGLLALAAALHGTAQALWGATGTWPRVGLTGLAVGLLAFLILTLVGGHGWGVRLLVIPATGLWVASGALSRSTERQAFYLAPIVALVSLMVIMALGYAAGAGIVYFVGPPLALCLMLAGHYLSADPVRHDWTGGHHIDRAYLAAALVVT